MKKMIKRKKADLFPYKIGVGLCYGTMHSGTVGSLDTRLDYAILGDPLKNAAKYEALFLSLFLILLNSKGLDDVLRLIEFLLSFLNSSDSSFLFFKSRLFRLS